MDFLHLRAYVEDISATLNDKAELENFISSMCFSEQYLNKTYDERNSNNPLVIAK